MLCNNSFAEKQPQNRYKHGSKKIVNISAALLCCSIIDGIITTRSTIKVKADPKASNFTMWKTVFIAWKDFGFYLIQLY